MQPMAESKHAEETTLIARILAGEKNLFHDLIRSYERRMYMTAFSILRNAGEAEDAVQETMLKAYRNLQSFRGEAKFSTWLTSIALNEARGRWRKSERRGSVSIDEERDQDDAGCDPYLLRDWREIPSEALERKDVADLLQAAVEELPEIYRTVFVLRDMEETSIEETARALGLQAGAVKVRLHRARMMLQKRLAPELQMTLPPARGIRTKFRRRP
jgi:RNA polymerase sigma-70 factor (ECF subfamily)